MVEKRAICLLSGGLDSCVSAAIAKKQDYSLYALTFEYGQQHQREVQSAQQIAESLQVQEHIVFPLDLKQFQGSSLVDDTQEIPDASSLDRIGVTIPSTYVPARNTIFLSIALALAEVKEADAIFIGVNEVDYSGYPDCRPEYIKAFQAMADLATKKAVEGKKTLIETPLLHLSKKEIIKKGVEVNAPYYFSWSCYRGEEQACGQCESCLLRLKGFQDAGVADPLIYQSYPDWYTQNK